MCIGARVNTPNRMDMIVGERQVAQGGTGEVLHRTVRGSGCPVAKRNEWDGIPRMQARVRHNARITWDGKCVDMGARHSRWGRG